MVDLQKNKVRIILVIDRKIIDDHALKEMVVNGLQRHFAAEEFLGTGQEDLPELDRQEDFIDIDKKADPGQEHKGQEAQDDFLFHDEIYYSTDRFSGLTSISIFIYKTEGHMIYWRVLRGEFRVFLEYVILSGSTYYSV